MKKIAMVMVVLAALTGCASTPESNDAGQYQKIVEVPNKPKNDIYDASMLWVAKSFKSAKAVTQYADKEAGAISGLATATDNFGGLGDTKVEFKFLIEMKDGKARFTFSDAKNIYDYSSGGRLAAALDPQLKGRNWEYFKKWADRTIGEYEQSIKSVDSNW